MFKGEYCSILKSGFLGPPPALGTEMDEIEDFSVSETLEKVCLSPRVLTVETVTLPLLFT